MDVKEVKLGAFSPAEETPAVQPIVETPVNTVQQTLGAEPPKDVTPISNVPPVAGTPPAATVPADAPVLNTPPAPPVQDDVIEFQQPSFETPSPVTNTPTPAQSQTVSWQDAIKDEATKQEILKAAGIDPLVLELDQHIKRGGKAEDYLNAKAVDYNKISDKDIIMRDLKDKYPTLPQEKLNRLFEGRYKQADAYDDDAKELGLIEMEADAANARAGRINKQQSYKLPEPIQQQAQPIAQSNPEAEQKAKQREQYYQKIFDSEATKNLMQSKRVAIDLGEGVKPINVSIPNPQGLFEVIFNPEVAIKAGQTPQGEPDVQFFHELGLFMSDYKQYKKLVRGNSRELGLQEVVNDGQNAVRPGTVIPMNTEPYSNVGEAFGKGEIKRVSLSAFDR